MSEQSHALVEVREAVRSLEHRTDSRFEAMERRIDALDQKVSSHFVWLVGLHVTTLVAISRRPAGAQLTDAAHAAAEPRRGLMPTAASWRSSWWPPRWSRWPSAASAGRC